MNLNEVNLTEEYLIKGIETADEDLKNFLLTLGCFEGEKITVVSQKKNNIVVALKDGRYCLDRELAKVIIV